MGFWHFSNNTFGFGSNRIVACVLISLFMGSSATEASQITSRRVASGLSRPVYVTAPKGDFGRVFIVEQHSGKIKILNLDTGLINSEPFLDIDGLATGNEQGLLGMAFDPDYAANGFFYVNLTRSGGGATYILRYRVSAGNADIANPGSETTIMTFGQPYSNHNGGWIGFGPDGFLYIGSGDGGSGNDPGNRAQDITDQKLGKLLRIDVQADDFPGDANRNYAIPVDNPFVGRSGDDEIWAYGLRNPWRAAFDRLTGDLYIADVGQNAREEIDFQPASSEGGENYGWRVMEGTRCNFANDALPCNDASFMPPIHEYLHGGAPDGGRSITGGYVYRGPIRSLQGTYFFADYVSEQIWSFRFDGANKSEFVNRTGELLPDVGAIGSISSFGEDAAGNLYIVDLGGEIFRIECGSAIIGDFNSDCEVDLTDFGMFAQGWLSESGDSWWNPDYDISDPSDGIVGMSDLDKFVINWRTDLGLAAYWQLDETSGPTADDSSAYGRAGALLNMDDSDWVTGRFGNALEFDGIDDRVQVFGYKGIGGGRSRTVCAWIKTTDTDGEIISWGPKGLGGRWVLLTQADGYLRLEVGGGAFVGSTFVCDGLWHHVAAVLENDGSPNVDEIKLYVDGATDDPTSAGDRQINTVTDPSVAPDVKIGLWGGGERFFEGLIDEVRIYDRALNAEEIGNLASP